MPDVRRRKLVAADDPSAGDRDEARLVAEAILGTMRQPLLVLDGELRVTTANAAFYRTFQVNAAETTGRPIYELGNSQWDIPELRKLLREILPSNGRVEDYRVEHEFERIGRRVMLLNAYRMERAGRPSTIILAIDDVTEREQARALLEAEKEYVEKIVDSSRDALLILDFDLRVKSANETFYNAFRVDPAETEGRLVYELGNGQWDIPKLRELLENVLPDNDAFDNYEVEHDFTGLGHRTMVLNARRVDHMQLILLAIEDRTESRRAAAALAESEAKFRVLVESAAEAVWETDPQGTVVEDSPSWRAFTGQTREELLRRGWVDALHPDDRDEAGRHWQESISAGQPHDCEVRVRRADGGWGWCHVRAAPVRARNGRITRWVGMISDIGRRKQAEEERELLLGELNHRIKNLFGVIRSLASQRSGSPEVEAYKSTLQGRLDALVRAHTVALESRWQSIDLRTLAARTLDPYTAERTDAIRILGDPLRLEARRALSVGLALHELATNSLKYGALSAPDGRVSLTWRVLRDDTGRRAELAWEESGGPEIREPERRGFGTKLIERVFVYDLQGTAELEFRPEGLRLGAAFPVA